MRARSATVTRARSLRRRMTEPEVLLWARLRRRLEGQPPWRRQHPLGVFVADFYCPLAGLVVEVDGHAHGYADKRARDEERDDWMRSEGLEIRRVLASSVYEDSLAVADGLRLLAAELTRAGSPLPPPFTGEGNHPKGGGAVEAVEKRPLHRLRRSPSPVNGGGRG